MASSPIVALIARFDAAALASNFTDAGGLWFDEVPEQVTTLPLAVLVHEGDGPPENTTEREYARYTDAHFEIYHTSLNTLGTVARQVEALFDLPGTNEAKAAFAIDNATVEECLIGSTQCFGIAERTPSDEKVYGARIPIRMKVWYTR